MMRLSDKVAIVTGGATGIGEAICKKFAHEGAKVVVNGLPGDPVQEVVEEIIREGGSALPFVADISEELNARECVEFAVQQWGKLDILINNAGTFPVMSEIQDYPIEAFDYMLKNNVRSAYLMTRFAMKYLHQTKGCIVSAGSEAGKKGLAGNSPYGGTKGFIHAFMKGVAVEQAKKGVRANCVCPGPIDTAWTHKETGPMSKKDEQMILSATPLGRRGTPEEVANVYLFLASDEASYVTGALFSVDGGITAAKGAVGDMAEKDVKKQPESKLELEHSLDGISHLK